MYCGTVVGIMPPPSCSMPPTCNHKQSVRADLDSTSKDQIACELTIVMPEIAFVTLISGE